MADEEDFLSRWSRRKVAARAGEPQPEVPEAAREAALPAAPASATPEAGTEAKAALPDLDSLTPDSDFTPFMSREVDGDVRNRALKALFSDPRFNTMDMLDVYVDDYSKPDPIPESWMGQLQQLARLGDRAARDREEEARRLAEQKENAVPDQEDAAAIAARNRDSADVSATTSGADAGSPERAAAEAPAIPAPAVRESGT